MPQPPPPQLVHDVVTSSAMLIYDDKTYTVRGVFKTTATALAAAHLQYPGMYERLAK